MKRRIISTILVVVMLALTLVGCGYDFTKKDMSEHAEFANGLNTEAFKAALKNLSVTDADFGAPTNAEKREAKIADYIYDLLLDEVDLKDAEAQLTDGKLDGNDVLYYAYYATYVEPATDEETDDKTVIIYPSKMDASSTSSVQLGASDYMVEGVGRAIRDAVLAAMTDNELDFSAYAYKITKDKTQKLTAGKVAYVTYTETANDQEKVYKNVKITLGEGGFLATELVKEGHDNKIATEIAELGVDDDGKKYTKVTVNYVVESGAPIVAKYKFEKDTTVSDVIQGSSVTVKKDTEVTYYVYPVHYFEVMENEAENILKYLIEELSQDSLDCLKDAEAEVKAFVTALEDYEKKETALEEATSKEKTEKSKYDEVVKKVKEETPEISDDDLAKDSAVVDAKTAWDDAVKALEAAKTAFEGAAATDNTEAVKGAKETYSEALAALYKKVGGTDNVAEGIAKIEEDYKKSVKDTLLTEYETSMKTNIGKAVWKLMKDSVTVNSVPEKAVDNIYDRMFESHEGTFYTGSHSSSGLSNYKYYSDNGGFKQYLIDNTIGTGKGDYEDAKDHLYAEAEEYVKEIVVIYFIAEQLDLKLTDDEVKEYKKSLSDYDSYAETYGEINILAAEQFNKLFDYFLEVQTEEDADGNIVDSKDADGNKIYVNVKVTQYKEAEESEESED